MTTKTTVTTGTTAPAATGRTAGTGPAAGTAGRATHSGSSLAIDPRTVLDDLEAGRLRAAEPDPTAADGWRIRPDVKAAIIACFADRTAADWTMGPLTFRDRAAVPPRTDLAGGPWRIVPGGTAVRRGVHLGDGVVVMPPSYLNVGAWVGPESMVDSHVLVGSCAQIGSNVHLSGGVGIGGVLEPPGAVPVIIEDDAFIGSRCIVVEGARVRRGAKLGAGAILTASTRVFDAETGTELARGEAPERAVCVGSTRVKSFAGGDFGMPVLLVLRRLDEGEIHDKLALNDVLREHGVAS